jgi:GTP pyrophosphokinase
MTQVTTVTLSKLLENIPEGSTAEDREKITATFEYARQAHADRRRLSGELYIEHDVAVAHTLTELEVDITTLSAGLLHDVMLSQSNGVEAEIRRNFGPEVAELVIALGKLDPYTDKHDPDRDDKSIEAIRRAILTIIDGDTRVILIHLADRLQDLRKASKLPRENQIQIALEARDIHAPLANRLGIWQLKWELEDLAFRYLEPERYRDIATLIAERRVERDRRIRLAADMLQQKLYEANIVAQVSGRPKHIYSIYRKMLDKGLNFENIYDIRALRVIIESTEPYSCYQVLGIVHSLWKPIPQEFDDYIARPKPNGYQSLHTAVVDASGQALEVQIRTRDMHGEAERGIAAHWAYKEGRRSNQYMSQHVNWLRQLLGTLQDSSDGSDESEAIQDELLGERIYVFTPRGDVVDLPFGSTPIDFAYAIHTEVGHRCRGARVNGKMVGLDYRLKSGDQVDIITSKKGGPSRDWMNENLNFTGSTRTRSKIRGWFRQQEREQNIAQGRDIVNRELKRLGVSDVYTLQDIAQALKHDETDQFLALVGFGDIQSSQIGGAISSLQQKLRPDDELRLLLKPQTERKSKQLTVRGIEGLHTRMAGCCNPIPPEPIVGYITRGRGVTIHTKECHQLMATKEPERWIEVEWGIEEETYPIPIIIKAFRRPGLMDDIANILKGHSVNLVKTKTTTSNSVSTINMIAEVSSLDQLNWILGKFERLTNVIEVRRERWAD